jgi:hypothetical protein
MSQIAATTAAILYAVGVVVLFRLRSWQQKRATGSTGFIGSAADRDRAARWPACPSPRRCLPVWSPLLALLGWLPVLNLGPTTA